MSKTPSAREQTYRSEVAKYVAAVLDKTGWSQAEAGRQVGQSHSTISRALSAKFETNYTTLLALSRAANLPLPEALEDAARQKHQPSTLPPGPSPAKVKDYVADVLSQPQELQRELFEALKGQFQ